MYLYKKVVNLEYDFTLYSHNIGFQKLEQKSVPFQGWVFKAPFCSMVPLLCEHQETWSFWCLHSCSVDVQGQVVTSGPPEVSNQFFALSNIKSYIGVSTTIAAAVPPPTCTLIHQCLLMRSTLAAILSYKSPPNVFCNWCCPLQLISFSYWRSSLLKMFVLYNSVLWFVILALRCSLISY